jgi:hypothetical protein
MAHGMAKPTQAGTAVGSHFRSAFVAAWQLIRPVTRVAVQASEPLGAEKPRAGRLTRASVAAAPQ